MTTPLETSLISYIEKCIESGKKVNFSNLAKIADISTRAFSKKYGSLLHMVENAQVEQKLEQERAHAARAYSILQQTLLLRISELKNRRLAINYPNIAKIEELTTQRVNTKYKPLSHLVEKAQLEQKLETARATAKRFGGELLDQEWKGPRAKLTWKCHDKNHKPFQQTAWQVENEYKWCPECTPRRRHGRPSKKS
jgi:hypothetical protein